jgi:L-ascorbate metabolism protein UlaG (beta-lactamase superfamily)
MPVSNASFSFVPTPSAEAVSPLAGFLPTQPAINPEDLGKIDAVLLSHDHHEDNLDHAGRALLPHAKSVITTSAGAKRLKGNAIGLRTWQSTIIESEDIQIKVTAAPSHHGTWGSHIIVGETTGFILEWAGQKHGALYISGDTVWFNGLREIGKRFKIGTAILHIGGARFPITGLARFTLNAKEAVRVIHALEPHMAIPIHYEGWKHFKETGADASRVFEASEIKEKIQWLQIKHGLGHGQAGTIVKMMYEGLDDYDEGELMKQHFSNGKEYLKPVYDKIMSNLKKYGTVRVSVNKTYLSLVNSQQFALVKSTKDGLVIGVPGAAVKATHNKEFKPTKNLGSDKITHKITLVDEGDLNEGVMRVLKVSYHKF